MSKKAVAVVEMEGGAVLKDGSSVPARYWVRKDCFRGLVPYKPHEVMFARYNGFSCPRIFVGCDKDGNPKPIFDEEDMRNKPNLGDANQDLMWWCAELYNQIVEFY